MANVVLVGMPGCGKSTVGVLLAKALGMEFLDTDVLLQAREGRLLQRMIDEDGVEMFLKREEAAVLSLCCDRTVIATGGSVVYSDASVEHLRSCGKIVYLELAFEQIERRLSNLATRGVALRPGQTLRALYEERTPLYRRAADIILHADGLGIEQTVDALKDRLKGMNADGD